MVTYQFLTKKQPWKRNFPDIDESRSYIKLQISPCLQNIFALWIQL